MSNVKWLTTLAVCSAGLWKLWADPEQWSVVFDVLCVLVVSWLAFVIVFYIAASRWRRAATSGADTRVFIARAQR